MGGVAGDVWASCDLANATICEPLAAGRAAAVAVYNQQSRARVVNVLLPVGTPPGVASYAVYDASLRVLAAQLLPLSDSDVALRVGYYRHGACEDLQGNWTDPHTPDDRYELAWRGAGFPAGAFIARSLTARDGWRTAYGQLSADNLTATIAFDIGVNFTGAVSRLCDAFQWRNNKSTWTRLTPAAALSNTHWLAFQAPAPAAGFATYFIVPSASASDAPLTHVSTAVAASAGDSALTNGVITLTFDGDTGLLRKYASTRSGVALPLSATLGWYNSSTGTLIPPGPPSGAYIFRA